MNVYMVKVKIAGDYWQLFCVQAESEAAAGKAVGKRLTCRHVQEVKTTRMDFDSSWRADRVVMIAQDAGQGDGMELYV